MMHSYRVETLLSRISGQSPVKIRTFRRQEPISNQVANKLSRLPWFFVYLVVVEDVVHSPWVERNDPLVKLPFTDAKQCEVS